jgi:hypothetical protein
MSSALGPFGRLRSFSRGTCIHMLINIQISDARSEDAGPYLCGRLRR